MKATWVIPATNPQEFYECWRSICASANYFSADNFDNEFCENLLVVDNSRLQNVGIEREESEWQGATFARRGFNIGVAASWNLGIQKMRDDKTDMLWIVSQSVRFRERTFGNLLHASEHSEAYRAVENTGFGWHLIGLKRELIDAVGLFDEDFYPAYYEETDFIRRAVLLGLRTWESGTNNGWLYINPEAIVGVNAGAMSRKEIDIDYGKSRDRYVAKWGGLPKEEKFTEPFNGQRS